MFNEQLLSQLRPYADRFSPSNPELSSSLETARAWLLTHFGEPGLLAAYFIAGVIGVLLLGRLAKLALSTLKYLAIPAVGLAALAAFFMGQPFLSVLPVTATGCALVLLFKG